MKKQGSAYSSTSPATIPPQLRRPAFWMSTAPRPPARLAPHATATASSSRATSTARMVPDLRTAAMSLPIHVSGTEAASVTPAASRPATILSAPVTAGLPRRRSREHHEGVGGQVQPHPLPDRERRGGGLGDEDEHALAVVQARGHFRLRALIDEPLDARLQDVVAG